jgi:hypothetical protein
MRPCLISIIAIFIVINH